jgi:hypothetical protein
MSREPKKLAAKWLREISRETFSHAHTRVIADKRSKGREREIERAVRAAMR